MTLSILEQRRIEAAFAKGVFEEMRHAGRGASDRDPLRAIVKLARQAGAALAAEALEPSIQHFVDAMERWKLDDALRTEALRQDDTHYDFNVTRCRYAETYRAMGLAKLGAVLSLQPRWRLVRGV